MMPAAFCAAVLNASVNATATCCRAVIIFTNAVAAADSNIVSWPIASAIPRVKAVLNPAATAARAGIKLPSASAPACGPGGADWTAHF